jgi:signal peptidase I
MKPNQADFLARYVLRSFAVVLILGVLLRTFVLSSFVMSGMSMLPSIWPGDFILGAKWGIHHPRRGDVVALRCPHDKDQMCLKRVVGLPGDRIEFQDGLLVVNGEKAVLKPVRGEISTESVGGAGWAVWPEAEVTAPAEPIVVPPQHVYLLNDKRSYPDDSRSAGPVNIDLIEARALRVWLSLDWFEGGEVRSWPRVRWERLLRSIN